MKAVVYQAFVHPNRLWCMWWSLAW